MVIGAKGTRPEHIRWTVLGLGGSNVNQETYSARLDSCGWLQVNEMYCGRLQMKQPDLWALAATEYSSFVEPSKGLCFHGTFLIKQLTMFGFSTEPSVKQLIMINHSKD